MLFDLASDFAGEWFVSGLGRLSDDNSTTREMRLTNIADRLPLFTRRTPPTGIIVTFMTLVAKGVLHTSDVCIALLLSEAQVADYTEGGVKVNLGDLVGVTSQAGVQMPATN